MKDMKRGEFIRFFLLCVQWAVGIALLLCDGEDVGSVLMAKCIGLAECCLLYWIGKRWLEAGKMPWTARLLDE